MKISLIWAMNQEGVIGVNNAMPWHIPSDMRFFRQNTQGKTVLMGRKTFESIGSKPLPKRTNIVLTRNQDWQAQGVEVVHSVDQAIELAKGLGEQELMVMGGSEIYELFFDRADRLYLTRVQMQVEGDAWFKHQDYSDFELNWQEAHQKNEQDPCDFVFEIYHRR